MNFNKALNCNANSTVVMLAHQPNAAKVILNEKAKTQRIDLILSGKKIIYNVYYLFI